MNDKDEKYLILEQYRIYSDAKEKFVERQFVTNRFYMVLNLAVLITAYILATLTPQYHPVIVLSIIGLSISIMWWMNIDTYQTLIKVKYANVLEYLETKLPEAPYHKEFVDYKEVKRNSKFVIFGDCQKSLALSIAVVNFLICAYNATNLVRYHFMV